MSYKEKNLGEPVDQAFVPYEVDPNAIAAQISNQAAEEGIPIQLTKVFSGEGKRGTWEAVRRGNWGEAVGTVIGSGIASSVKAVKKIGFSLMHSASELEEEKAWYNFVMQMLAPLFS